MGVRYTYEPLSDRRLEALRSRLWRSRRRGAPEPVSTVVVEKLITEVLALLREADYWRGLTHVRLGGRRHS